MAFVTDPATGQLQLVLDADAAIGFIRGFNPALYTPGMSVEQLTAVAQSINPSMPTFVTGTAPAPAPAPAPAYAPAPDTSQLYSYGPPASTPDTPFTPPVTTPANGAPSNVMDVNRAIYFLKEQGLYQPGMDAATVAATAHAISPDVLVSGAGSGYGAYVGPATNVATLQSSGIASNYTNPNLNTPASTTTFVNPYGPTTGTTKAILPVGTTTTPATGTTTGTTKATTPTTLTTFGPPSSTGGTTTPTTLTTFGPPASLAPSPTTTTPSNVNSFMTPGLNFPPRTQFNQAASAPLNISQQGNIYGAPAPISTLPVTPPPTQFRSVQPGGATGAVPTFQNPFTTPALVPTSTATSFNTLGADIARNALLSRGFTQANVAGMNANQLATEMGRINPGESYKIVNFADGGMTGMNNMNGMTSMVPQFQNPFGSQPIPVGQSMYNPGQQQPQQHQSISVGGTPQQPGLPGLIPANRQNQYPQGYTPIGQQPQTFLTLN